MRSPFRGPTGLLPCRIGASGCCLDAVEGPGRGGEHHSRRALSAVENLRAAVAGTTGTANAGCQRDRGPMSEVRGPGVEIAPDEVRRTVETGEFAIVFQPVVALDTQVVGGY